MIDATLEPVEALKQRIEAARQAILVADRMALALQGLLCFHPDALHEEVAEQLLSQWKAARDAALDHRTAPDTDHCPSCGEYLHDEMGHMCPPHSDAPEERDRAGRTDHEYDQNPFYTGPGCAVCGLPTEAHAEGAKKLEERDRAVREEVIRVLVEADTNCEMYAAIECIRREFGLEG